ncbi:MAG: hypothetical protein M1496_04030 [Candidatus Thermoplasmatota archaeon]|jgi:hypothetical protein|nr:hypothetical protein [Candidatus Thermoplasmatota archaeon]
MSEIGTIRYLLALIGGVISLLSGILVLVFSLIGATISAFVIFSPISFAGLAGTVGFFILIVYALVILILSYAIINYSGELKSSRKNKTTYGILILLFSIVLFFIGAGFAIGPILSGIGGLLIIL